MGFIKRLVLKALNDLLDGDDNDFIDRLIDKAWPKIRKRLEEVAAKG